MSSGPHPFEQFKKVELESSRLNLEPHILFICGGEVDVKKMDTLSLRERFFESFDEHGYPTYHDSCIRAETFKDYHETGQYKDLAAFENDLAHIASLLVIFLESAGSIVELGLFSANEMLRKKLLVVVNQKHHNNDSFIKLGPLATLRRANKDSVCVYPWELHNPAGISKDDLGFIFEDVNSALSKIDATIRFDKDDPGHICFLIYEIIRIYRALRIGEIRQLLSFHGIKVDNTRINNFIYLLSISEYVKEESLGRDTFYVCVKSFKKIKYKSKDLSDRFDDNSMFLESSIFYSREESEKRRHRIIEMNTAPEGV